MGMLFCEILSSQACQKILLHTKIFMNEKILEGLQLALEWVG